MFGAEHARQFTIHYSLLECGINTDCCGIVKKYAYQERLYVLVDNDQSLVCYNPSTDSWESAAITCSANTVLKGICYLPPPHNAFYVLTTNQPQLSEPVTTYSLKRLCMPSFTISDDEKDIGLPLIIGSVTLVGKSSTNETIKSVCEGWICFSRLNAVCNVDTKQVLLPGDVLKTDAIDLTSGLVQLNAQQYMVIGTSTNTVYDSIQGQPQSKAPCRVARLLHATVFTDNKIYVCGGTQGYQPWDCVYNTVECYDVSKDEWCFVAPMQTARQRPWAVALDGSIYVGGGSSEKYGELSATVEVYDAQRDVWKYVTPMPACAKSISVTKY